VLLEQRAEADARTVEQLGREHGVEKAARAEAAEVVQEAQVEIAPVHEEVFVREAGPEAVELEGRERVDEEDFVADEELQEADPRAVVIHVVRLCIEGDLIDLVEGVEEGCDLTRLVDEGVGGRT